MASAEYDQNLRRDVDTTAAVFSEPHKPLPTLDISSPHVAPVYYYTTMVVPADECTGVSFDPSTGACPLGSMLGVATNPITRPTDVRLCVEKPSMLTTDGKPLASVLWIPLVRELIPRGHRSNEEWLRALVAHKPEGSDAMSLCDAYGEAHPNQNLTGFMFIGVSYDPTHRPFDAMTAFLATNAIRRGELTTRDIKVHELKADSIKKSILDDLNNAMVPLNKGIAKKRQSIASHVPDAADADDIRGATMIEELSKMEEALLQKKLGLASEMADTLRERHSSTDAFIVTAAERVLEERDIYEHRRVNPTLETSPSMRYIAVTNYKRWVTDVLIPTGVSVKLIKSLRLCNNIPPYIKTEIEDFRNKVADVKDFADFMAAPIDMECGGLMLIRYILAITILEFYTIPGYDYIPMELPVLDLCLGMPVDEKGRGPVCERLEYRRSHDMFFVAMMVKLRAVKLVDLVNAFIEEALITKCSGINGITPAVRKVEKDELSEMDIRTAFLAPCVFPWASSPVAERVFAQTDPRLCEMSSYFSEIDGVDADALDPESMFTKARLKFSPGAEIPIFSLGTAPRLEKLCCFARPDTDSNFAQNAIRKHENAQLRMINEAVVEHHKNKRKEAESGGTDGDGNDSDGEGGVTRQRNKRLDLQMSRSTSSLSSSTVVDKQKAEIERGLRDFGLSPTSIFSTLVASTRTHENAHAMLHLHQFSMRRTDRSEYMHRLKAIEAADNPTGLNKVIKPPAMWVRDAYSDLFSRVDAICGTPEYPEIIRALRRDVLLAYSNYIINPSRNIAVVSSSLIHLDNNGRKIPAREFANSDMDIPGKPAYDYYSYAIELDWAHIAAFGAANSANNLYIVLNIMRPSVFDDEHGVHMHVTGEQGTGKSYMYTVLSMCSVKKTANRVNYKTQASGNDRSAGWKLCPIRVWDETPAILMVPDTKLSATSGGAKSGSMGTSVEDEQHLKTELSSGDKEVERCYKGIGTEHTHIYKSLGAALIFGNKPPKCSAALQDRFHKTNQGHGSEKPEDSLIRKALAASGPTSTRKTNPEIAAASDHFINNHAMSVAQNGLCLATALPHVTMHACKIVLWSTLNNTIFMPGCNERLRGYLRVCMGATYLTQAESVFRTIGWKDSELRQHKMRRFVESGNQSNCLAITHNDLLATAPGMFATTATSIRSIAMLFPLSFTFDLVMLAMGCHFGKWVPPGPEFRKGKRYNIMEDMFLASQKHYFYVTDPKTGRSYRAHAGARHICGQDVNGRLLPMAMPHLPEHFNGRTYDEMPDWWKTHDRLIKTVCHQICNSIKPDEVPNFHRAASHSAVATNTQGNARGRGNAAPSDGQMRTWDPNYLVFSSAKLYETLHSILRNFGISMTDIESVLNDLKTHSSIQTFRFNTISGSHNADITYLRNNLKWETITSTDGGMTQLAVGNTRILYESGNTGSVVYKLSTFALMNACQRHNIMMDTLTRHEDCNTPTMTIKLPVAFIPGGAASDFTTKNVPGVVSVNINTFNSGDNGVGKGTREHKSKVLTADNFAEMTVVSDNGASIIGMSAKELSILSGDYLLAATEVRAKIEAVRDGMMSAQNAAQSNTTSGDTTTQAIVYEPQDAPHWFLDPINVELKKDLVRSRFPVPPNIDLDAFAVANKRIINTIPLDARVFYYHCYKNGMNPLRYYRFFPGWVEFECHRLNTHPTPGVLVFDPRLFWSPAYRAAWIDADVALLEKIVAVIGDIYTGELADEPNSMDVDIDQTDVVLLGTIPSAPPVAPGSNGSSIVFGSNQPNTIAAFVGTTNTRPPVPPEELETIRNIQRRLFLDNGDESVLLDEAAPVPVAPVNVPAHAPAPIQPQPLHNLINNRPRQPMANIGNVQQAQSNFRYIIATQTNQR